MEHTFTETSIVGEIVTQFPIHLIVSYYDKAYLTL
ncbi:Uncharacterised protein [Streptococcus pneumoniae]|nr:Uncharacterised protein [Streptococcus pneumoniae]